ncbi:hypothetical protein CTI14_66630, partial [Methylobacterium radiotolerans]
LTVIATPVLVAVMWWQDWPSGLTAVITLPLIPLFLILIGSRPARCRRSSGRRSPSSRRRCSSRSCGGRTGRADSPPSSPCRSSR